MKHENHFATKLLSKWSRTILATCPPPPKKQGLAILWTTFLTMLEKQNHCHQLTFPCAKIKFTTRNSSKFTSLTNYSLELATKTSLKGYFRHRLYWSPKKVPLLTKHYLAGIQSFGNTAERQSGLPHSFNWDWYRQCFRNPSLIDWNIFDPEHPGSLGIVNFWGSQ